MADRLVSAPASRCTLHAPMLAGLAGFLAYAVPASAESVIAPTSPVAAQQLNDSLAEAGLSPSATAATTPLQWANIAIRPHFHYRYLYSDGLRAGPGRQTKTTLHTVSPGVLFELGTRWSLNYTASQTYYNSDDFRDRLGHSVSLNGGAGYGNLSLSLSHRYSLDATPLAETGDQTKREIHSTSLNGAYSLGSRSGLSSSVNYSSRSSENSPSYDQWSYTAGFQYQLQPNLKAALTVGFGTVNVDTSTDMSYVRPQLQLSWQPSEKISMGVQAGMERREFKDSGVGARESPTYSGSIAYRALENTTVVLSGSRSLSVSYFSNLVTEGTSWGLSLNQRLLQRFTLSARYSWSESEYIATRLGVAATRKDESNTLSLRLSTQLIDRLSVGLTYQKTDYDSNASAFAYSSSQIGAELGYSF